MSRRCLIDGYNVIKSFSPWMHMSLREGREAFVCWLRDFRPQGSYEAIVVFDGQSDVYGGVLHMPGIRMLFTSSGSADDYIRHYVEEARDVKSLMVVSNDKDIALYARALGATVMRVGDFLKIGQKINRKLKNTSRDQVQGSEKYISHSQAAQINQELWKRWVKHD